MSRARRRWPLVLALLVLLGVAAGVSWVARRAWKRAHEARLVATIPFGTQLPLVTFTGDDTFVTIEESGARVRVWSLRGDTAELTSEGHGPWAEETGDRVLVDTARDEVRARLPGPGTTTRGETVACFSPQDEWLVLARTAVDHPFFTLEVWKLPERSP